MVCLPCPLPQTFDGIKIKFAIATVITKVSPTGLLVAKWFKCWTVDPEVPGSSSTVNHVVNLSIDFQVH